MRRIKIFIDNTIIPADIYAGQKIAFIFLPAGRQTAQGREQVVHQASVENENGRVINVTWQAKGWFNRLVTRHSPLLRRMLFQLQDRPHQQSQHGIPEPARTTRHLPVRR